MRCYLESSKFTPNVPIYERLGFRLVGEMTLNDGGDICNVLAFAGDSNVLVVWYDKGSQGK